MSSRSCPRWEFHESGAVQVVSQNVIRDADIPSALVSQIKELVRKPPSTHGPGCSSVVDGADWRAQIVLDGVERIWTTCSLGAPLDALDGGSTRYFLIGDDEPLLFLFSEIGWRQYRAQRLRIATSDDPLGKKATRAEDDEDLVRGDAARAFPAQVLMPNSRAEQSLAFLTALEAREDEIRRVAYSTGFEKCVGNRRGVTTQFVRVFVDHFGRASTEPQKLKSRKQTPITDCVEKRLRSAHYPAAAHDDAGPIEFVVVLSEENGKAQAVTVP